MYIVIDLSLINGPEIIFANVVIHINSSIVHITLHNPGDYI